MMEPKYPHIKVKMVGEGGNAFAILGRCRQAMREAGLPQSDIDQFMKEAMKSDYDHLLQTVMRWFEAE